MSSRALEGYLGMAEVDVINLGEHVVVIGLLYDATRRKEKRIKGV